MPCPHFPKPPTWHLSPSLWHTVIFTSWVSSVLLSGWLTMYIITPFLFLACLGVMYLVLPPHTDSDTLLAPILVPIMSASTSLLSTMENIPIRTGDSKTSFIKLDILSVFSSADTRLKLYKIRLTHQIRLGAKLWIQIRLTRIKSGQSLLFHLINFN